jgi:hypothetical protein
MRYWPLTWRRTKRTVILTLRDFNARLTPPLEANDGSVTVGFDYEDGKLKSESNTLAPGIAVEYVYNYLDADLASIATLVGATFQSKTLDSHGLPVPGTAHRSPMLMLAFV